MDFSVYKRLVVCIALLLAGLVHVAPAPAQDSAPGWPTDGWPVSTPEEQGMDSGTLAEMLALIQEQEINIRSVLVVRNGTLVLEAYAYPYDEDTPHELRSCTKSVLSALFGIALDQGYIDGVDRPMLEFFPDRTVENRDEDKQAMTLEHLLTMTAGFDWPDARFHITDEMVNSPDWVQFVLDKPVVAEPGDTFQYNNGVSHVLSAILQTATGEAASAFAQEHLFAPLGISDVSWEADPQGITIGMSGLWMLPRDMAKFGYLYLRYGEWDSAQIVPADWVATSTRDHSPLVGAGYGYQWWVFPSEDLSFYAAQGYGGQHIFIVPERDLVVVFTGGLARRNETAPESLLRYFVLPAAESTDPLPENPAAVAELQARIEAFARPVAHAVPPLPPIAGDVSGLTYALENNAFGWEAFSLGFQAGASEAQIILTGGDGERSTLPIGLDNVFRLAPPSTGNTVLLRGTWDDTRTFNLEFEILGVPERFHLRFAFEADTVRVQSHELSMDVAETFGGKLQE